MQPRDIDTFYSYTGSLTTPPCSEAVSWILFPAPLHVSFDQVNWIQFLETFYFTKNKFDRWTSSELYLLARSLWWTTSECLNLWRGAKFLFTDLRMALDSIATGRNIISRKTPEKKLHVIQKNKVLFTYHENSPDVLFHFTIFLQEFTWRELNIFPWQFKDQKTEWWIWKYDWWALKLVFMCSSNSLWTPPSSLCARACALFQSPPTLGWADCVAHTKVVYIMCTYTRSCGLSRHQCFFLANPHGRNDHKFNPWTS